MSVSRRVMLMVTHPDIPFGIQVESTIGEAGVSEPRVLTLMDTDFFRRITKADRARWQGEVTAYAARSGAMP